MKKIKLIPSRKLLGVYIILLGLSLFFKVIFSDLKIILFVLSLVALLSINSIIRIFNNKLNKKYIVISVFSLLMSLFFIIYILFLEKIVKIDRLWPIMGFFPALGLIVYYFISEKKNPATIIPGIFIALLSFVLMVITLGLFPLISFEKILLLIISFMIIFIGMYFVFKK
jgi:hypothetical protein